MTYKEKISKLLNKHRNGKLLTAVEYKRLLRLTMEHTLLSIATIQAENDEDGVLAPVVGQLMSELKILNKAVMEYDAAHQDPGEKEKLKKGTYGGIYEDDEGEPVESSWDDTETPQA